MRYYARIQERCDLSEVEIIDTVANYFKHYCEWPREWYLPSCALPKAGATTIRKARAIGMNSTDRTENLLLSLGMLEIPIEKVDLIADKIQRWREALAAKIRDDPDESLDHAHGQAI